MVACYWFAERHFTPAQDPFIVLPDSQLELVFSSGVTYAAYGDQGDMQLIDGYLVGLLDRPLYIRSDGLLRTLGARLYPWACACLLQGQDTPYIKHAGVIHGLFPALAETIASAYGSGSRMACVHSISSLSPGLPKQPQLIICS
jgi:hypothetical protein